MMALRARSAETHYVRPPDADVLHRLIRQARAAGLCIIDLKRVRDIRTAAIVAAEHDRQATQRRMEG